MRSALWLFLLVILQAAVSQECTATAPVNVLTYDTHQPLPFQPEHLHASIGNTPISFSSMEKLQHNRILILVDVSGSMEQKLPFVRVTLQLLLQEIRIGSSVAFGFFATEHHLTSGFTTDPKEFSNAIQELNGYKAQGKTALRDALHDGLKLFNPTKPGDSVLLITDGGENRSELKESTMEKEIRESGVRIFALVPLGPSIVLPEEEFGLRWLEEMANRTGGRVFTIYHNWPLMDKKWLRLVAALIQNFWLDGVGGGYLLTVKLPSNLTKPIRWKLRLDTSGDKRLKDGTVLYPEKLMPCPGTAAAVH